VTKAAPVSGNFTTAADGRQLEKRMVRTSNRWRIFFATEIR
jgi:hypothetical protein